MTPREVEAMARATRVDGSHIRSREDLQIFCAALSGICGNPEFFGAIMQQSPLAAAEFAAEVVRVTQAPPLSSSPYATPPAADGDGA